MPSFLIQATGDSKVSHKQYRDIADDWWGSSIIKHDKRHVGIDIPIHNDSVQIYHLDVYLSYHFKYFAKLKKFTVDDRNRLDKIYSVPNRRTFLLMVPDSFDDYSATRISEWLTTYFGGYVTTAFPVTYQAHFTSTLHKRFSPSQEDIFKRNHIEKTLLT